MTQYIQCLSLFLVALSCPGFAGVGADFLGAFDCIDELGLLRRNPQFGLQMTPLAPEEAKEKLRRWVRLERLRERASALRQTADLMEKMAELVRDRFTSELLTAMPIGDEALETASARQRSIQELAALLAPFSKDEAVYRLTLGQRTTITPSQLNSLHSAYEIAAILSGHRVAFFEKLIEVVPLSKNLSNHQREEVVAAYKSARREFGSARSLLNRSQQSALSLYRARKMQGNEALPDYLKAELKACLKFYEDLGVPASILFDHLLLALHAFSVSA
jgi:hypothetical protein